MHTSAAFGMLSLCLWLCSGTARAEHDQRVLKAIDLFDRAEFARCKNLLVGLVDAPSLSEEDRLQARIYLAASYYSLGDRASARAQFQSLVRRYPGVELDPGTFLPEVLDLLQQARAEVARESRATTRPPAPSSPPKPSTPPIPATAPAAVPAPPPAGPGLATFLPFGAGQFARGDPLAGHLFLWSEAGTLALAVAAKIHFQYLKVGPSRPWDFGTPAYVADVNYATAVQNVFAGALIASAVLAVAGVAESVLHAGGARRVTVAAGPSGGKIVVCF